MNEFWQVNIGSLSTLAILAIGLFKFVRHLNRIEERFNILWIAMFGTGIADNESWFHRLAIMEQQVKELWEAHVFRKRREDVHHQ